MTRQRRAAGSGSGPGQRVVAARSSATGPRRGATPARVRARTCDDLLALVPYLLGFTPQESLVVLLIRDRHVLLTARVDLPSPGHLDLVQDQFARLADQHGSSGLVLVVYSSDGSWARSLLRRLGEGLAAWEVLDAVYVDGGRWWSVLCADGCCPPGGTPYDPGRHPLAAEAVYAGLTAAPSRGDVAALVQGPAAGAVDRLGAVARRLAGELAGLSTAERCRRMSAAVCEQLVRPRRLDDADCLLLAVLADDLAVRDVAWALMSREDIDSHLDLWTQVVSRAVAPWELAPLCLLGMAAWISGNGALQNCCSERAQRLDPAYSMAGLLEEINQRALQPSFWDELGPQIRAEVLRSDGREGGGDGQPER